MDRPPNVLMLAADSLRYDAVFGSDSAETTDLNRLASNSVVFERCYSQGISTAPAMTAMLTGRYPLDYGGHWYITDDQPTMAEQFRQNGYATAAIHSNPNVSRLRNFDKGFETFDEHIVPVGGGLFERLPNAALRLINKGARVLSKSPYVPAETINEQLLEWIRDADDSWFCWTQYMDTHGPYLPGDDFSYRNKVRAERLWRKAAVESPEDVTDEEHAELRENYRREVEYLDAEIGRLLAHLDADGILEETIVILTADHGDEFGEHGQYGHGNLPYEELVHVPLLMRFPRGMSIEPTRSEVPVRCIDALPTVLDAVDATLSPAMEERLIGQSLRPVIEGESPEYDVIVTEKEMRHENALRFGLRTGDWTYLYDGLADEAMLFDRANDPGEREDVSDAHPEVTERFEAALSDRLDSIERTSAGVETPEIDARPGVEDRLRALGYRD